jgi:outer membrane protein assembly factor BamB
LQIQRKIFFNADEHTVFIGVGSVKLKRLIRNPKIFSIHRIKAKILCMKVLRILFPTFLLALISFAQPIWQTDIKSKIQFYQTTDFGVLLVGTDRVLSAVDGKTGEILWKRNHAGLDETSISTIPDTDLVLISLDAGDKSRLEAIDLLSGETIWRSEKVKGDVMHLAVDAENDLLCVILAKKARGKVGEKLERTPRIHVLQLSNGREIWKSDLDNDVEMMPTEFAENKEVGFTFDNYRPPMILDGKLYLFYEGSTVFDVRTGDRIERDKFKVNEKGLALTEADVIFDDRNVYLSGRGRIRAVDRRSGKTKWKADDLGVTAEIFLVNSILYVRTGGQFTKIKDGETEEKGAFGISAIDTANGKTLWRFKGGDKGLTNFIFSDANTITVADKDDLIQLDARNGKRIRKIDHKIDKAQFVIQNENNQTVVGGKDTISAFNNSLQKVWTTKHKSPGRGILRITAAIALRATALYFRYGGLISSGIGLAKGGSSLYKSILSSRSGFLRNRVSSIDLTGLATNYARNYVTDKIPLYGVASRVRNAQGLQISRPNINLKPNSPSIDVQEKLLDRLDPIRQAERLSNYLLQRKRLSELRGNYMYFYTDLPKPFDKKGLIGVNVQDGDDARFILVGEPDARFITDEINGLLYSADGNKLSAFDVLER